MSWGIYRNDPAIRVTHVPTGTTVLCAAERSQHRNKAMAMQALRAKLYAQSIGMKPVAPPDGFVEPAGSYLDNVVDLSAGLPDWAANGPDSVLWGSSPHHSPEQVIEDIKAAINRLARLSGMDPPYSLVASKEPSENPETF